MTTEYTQIPDMNQLIEDGLNAWVPPVPSNCFVTCCMGELVQWLTKDGWVNARVEHSAGRLMLCITSGRPFTVHPQSANRVKWPVDFADWDHLGGNVGESILYAKKHSKQWTVGVISYIGKLNRFIVVRPPYTSEETTITPSTHVTANL